MGLRKFLLLLGKWFTSASFGGIMSIFVAWLALIFPLISTDELEKFFRIGGATDIALRIGLGIGGTLILLAITQGVGHTLLFWGKRTRPRIDILPLPKPEQEINGLIVQNFATLKVINNEDAELTECFAILKNGHHSSIPDNVWSEQGKMGWKGADTCEVKVTAFGGEALLRIYELFLDLQKNDVSLSCFNICDGNKRLNPVGKYEFYFELNGKLDGEPIAPIPFRGSFDVSVIKDKDSIQIGGLVIKPAT